MAKAKTTEIPQEKKKAKRCNGEGSLYFNEQEQRWEGWVSYTKPDGTKDRKKFTNKKKEIVKEKMDAFNEELKRQEELNKRGGAITLEDWFVQWLDIHMKNRMKRTTKEHYEERIRLHINPVLGDKLLNELTAYDVQKFINDLYENGARKDGKSGGLAHDTIENILRILTSALNDAVEVKVIKENPVDSKIALKEEVEKKIKPLERVELKALFRAARKSRYFLVLLIAYCTGMRRGEILGLSWDNVDLEKKRINVRQQYVRTATGENIFQTPKTKSSIRTISLPEKLVRLLSLTKRKAKKNSHNLVIYTTKGEPVSPHNFQKQFARWVENSGMRHVRFHDLRHTHVAELIRAGASLKAIQDRLGHKDFKMTFDVYGHLQEEIENETAMKMDAILGDFLKAS